MSEDYNSPQIVQKGNPWQAVSFLLIGVLIGLGIGKFSGYIEGASRTFDDKDISQIGTAQVVQQVPQQPTEPFSPPAPPEIELASVSEEDHVRGAKNPEITFVEFSDLECPFCKKFHEPMLELVNKYGDKVAWVYRHMPLDSLHSKARKEAEATECASEQGKFWEYIDRLFEVTPSNDGLDLEELPKIAEYVGLDVDEFNTCLDDGKYASTVQKHLDQAIQAGGNGTPYTVVITKDGKKIPLTGWVPFSRLEQIVKDNT